MQLLHHIVNLSHACGVPVRTYSLALQTAAQIHGQGTVPPRASFGCKEAAASTFDEAQVFHRNDFGNGEAVVEFGELDLRRPCCLPSHKPFCSRPAGAGKVVISCF